MAVVRAILSVGSANLTKDKTVRLKPILHKQSPLSRTQDYGGFIVRIGDIKLPKVSLKGRLALRLRYVVALGRSFLIFIKSAEAQLRT